MAHLLSTLNAGRKVYLKIGTTAAGEILNPADTFFNKYSTTQEFELIQGTTGFGFANSRAELGDSIEQNRRPLYQVTVTPVNWTIKWSESWQSKEFDQYGKTKENPKLAGRALKHTEIRAMTNVLNNAFNTGGSYNGPDGVSLCNDAHPTNGGVTYDNNATAADLSESTALAALQQLRALKDPNGMQMASQINCHLVHPIDLMGRAQKIKKSLNIPESTDNDKNVVAEYISPLMLDYLTDTNAWFIVSKDKSQHSISVMTRKPMYMNMKEDVEGDRQNVMGKEWATFWIDGYGVIGNAGA